MNKSQQQRKIAVKQRERSLASQAHDHCISNKRVKQLRQSKSVHEVSARL